MNLQKIRFRDFLTSGCPSSSLHAQKVSWMYQSGNAHTSYEKQVSENSNIF
eukprot:UN27139